MKKKMIKTSLLFLFCFTILFMMSCKSEYTKYVERETKKGMTEDSLIFGMKIGQTQKDFYAICWELNRQKLISQGDGNMNAKYIEPIDSTGKKDPVLRKEMYFYGIFDKDKVMKGMDIRYNYLAWAIWSKKTHSDSLILELKDSLIAQYGGNDFMEINLDKIKYKAFVKIDGQRQIMLYQKNDKDVAVKIKDINYKENSEQIKK